MPYYAVYETSMRHKSYEDFSGALQYWISCVKCGDNSSYLAITVHIV